MIPLCLRRRLWNCLIADNDNPLNWASNEGVELLRQKQDLLGKAIKDTKSKLETLAYLQDMKLQELCIGLITDVINENAEAIAEVEKNLEGAELIIGIGSGVIQDLCKYVSFKNKIPYMVDTAVIGLDEDKTVTATNAENGCFKIKAKPCISSAKDGFHSRRGRRLDDPKCVL